MLSSDLDFLPIFIPFFFHLYLTSHIHVEYEQFIGTVTTIRDTSYTTILILFCFFKVISLQTSLTFFFSKLLHPVCHCLTFIFASHNILHHFFNQLFIPDSSDSSTGASLYSRSGQRRSQSREDTRVGMRVSWWKPSSHSPVDEGNALSVSEALKENDTFRLKWVV